MGQVRRKSKFRSFTKNRKARIASGILAFLGAILLSVWVLLYTGPERPSQDTPFNALRAVSVLEMTDRAVGIVKAGDSAHRDELIQESLKAVSALARPGIMPYTVSGLARAFPDRLEVILGAAMDLQPDLVLFYAQACIVQLPAKVEEISYALAKRTPYAAAVAETLANETRDHEALIRGIQRGILEYRAPGNASSGDNQAKAPNSSLQPTDSNLASPADLGQHL
jgi:hypothetical protein